MSASSFSVGLRLYYWPYYQTIKHLPDAEQNITHYDHSGYAVCELFVRPKYAAFKEEILNYKYITFQQYTNDIVTKVNTYINTDIVKETTANKSICLFLHYGISARSRTILGFKNLVSLILYTDYSDLCKHFSATFRKMKAYE
eukprot:489010_1